MSSVSDVQRMYQQPWPEGDYRLWQLGFVVDDVLEDAARWASVLGIGPFHVLPRSQVPSTYRGAPVTNEMQIAVAQAGPVQIELFQQFDDSPSIYRELQASGRSRFHQLATLTRDHAGTVAHYTGLGYEVAAEIANRGPRVAMIDTLDDFGFFVEVVEHNDRFVASLETIARTCAAWDGADPVRLVTRDGYTTP